MDCAPLAPRNHSSMVKLPLPTSAGVGGSTRTVMRSRATSVAPKNLTDAVEKAITGAAVETSAVKTESATQMSDASRSTADGRRAVRRRALRLLALVVLVGACDPGASQRSDEPRAPVGVRPGTRLPFPEVSAPVTDWSFASTEEEIALETPDGRGGYRSVTVWCVAVDGRLYIATDSSTRPKRWVRELEQGFVARVGIAGRAYPVKARHVTDAGEWDAVVAAYARKYARQIARYDFPRAGDLTRGRIYELASRSP